MAEGVEDILQNEDQHDRNARSQGQIDVGKADRDGARKYPIGGDHHLDGTDENDGGQTETEEVDHHI